MDEWINKICLCIVEYYLILKKEGNSDMCYNMDKLEDMMFDELKQTQKDIHCMILRT